MSEAPKRPAPNLDNIAIVLSHTTETANIGSCARAMKTMGLSRLRLVAPHNPKGRTAMALAHGAEDVLGQAEEFATTADSVADASIIAGTTSRKRQLRKHALLSVSDMADKLVELSRTEKIVLLFGTERTGLTNDETNMCRYLSTIDTATPQPSLNLAMAVQVYGWEIRQALLRAEARDDEARIRSKKPARPREMNANHPHRSTKLPSGFELDVMYTHMGEAMRVLDYTAPERRKFLTYLRQLHMRAGIVDWEMNIYHLLANRILRKLGYPPFNPD